MDIALGRLMKHVSGKVQQKEGGQADRTATNAPKVLLGRKGCHAELGSSADDCLARASRQSRPWCRFDGTGLPAGGPPKRKGDRCRRMA